MNKNTVLRWQILFLILLLASVGLTHIAKEQNWLPRAQWDGFAGVFVMGGVLALFIHGVPVLICASGVRGYGEGGFVWLTGFLVWLAADIALAMQVTETFNTPWLLIVGLVLIGAGNWAYAKFSKTPVAQWRAVNTSTFQAFIYTAAVVGYHNSTWSYGFLLGILVAKCVTLTDRRTVVAAGIILPFVVVLSEPSYAGTLLANNRVTGLESYTEQPLRTQPIGPPEEPTLQVGFRGGMNGSGFDTVSFVAEKEVSPRDRVGLIFPVPVHNPGVGGFVEHRFADIGTVQFSVGGEIGYRESNMDKREPYAFPHGRFSFPIHPSALFVTEVGVVFRGDHAPAFTWRVGPNFKDQEPRREYKIPWP